MTNLEKALEKAKQNFPIGARVAWCGTFNSGYQQGEGVVTGYNSDYAQTGFVRVILFTPLGEKQFSVADPDNENFKPTAIVRI